MFVLVVFLILAPTDCGIDVYSGQESQVYGYVTQKYHSNSTFFPHSLKSWTILDSQKSSRLFSVVTMTVDHHSDGSWFIPALHSKYSIGWNRSASRGFLDRPFACNIRFIGTALEWNTLQGYEGGGGGYITLTYSEGKKEYWNGFHKNETYKIYCYYMTNKDFGSEFLVHFLCH